MRSITATEIKLSQQEHYFELARIRLERVRQTPLSPLKKAREVRSWILPAGKADVSAEKAFGDLESFMWDCHFLVRTLCSSADANEWWEQDKAMCPGAGAESLKRQADNGSRCFAFCSAVL